MTMSTKELAESLCVAKDTINATVERLELNGVLRRVEIQKNSQGGYMFNELQATMIKQEIQKHHNLANRTVDTAMTEIEEDVFLYRAMQILQKRVTVYKQRAEQAEYKLIEQQPKVDFYNAVAACTSWIDFEQVSKTIGIRGLGRNNLFKFLKQNGILQSNNNPYQEYIDRGYFKLVESSFVDKDGRQRIYSKTVVSQKGLGFILKLTQKINTGENLCCTKKC